MEVAVYDCAMDSEIIGMSTLEVAVNNCTMDSETVGVLTLEIAVSILLEGKTVLVYD